MNPYFFIAAAGAYLLGSIPTAVWWGRIFFGVDVREHGSGNAGATNTFRVLGKKAGIPVLLFDVAKGVAAVDLMYIIPASQPGTAEFSVMQIVLALAAMLGHIYSVFLGFKGGKGIATGLGVLIALHPPAALSCLLVFTVLLIITKYVSLSSVITGIIFPVMLVFVFRNILLPLNIFSVVVAVLVLYTHRSNLRRLWKGEENRTYLFGKRGSKSGKEGS